MTDTSESPDFPSHDSECTCFRCKIKSVQVSPKATPSRTRIPQKPKDPNSWEKGIAYQRDGMPHLNPGTVSPMPIKTYVENKHKIEEGQRKMRQAKSQED